MALEGNTDAAAKATVPPLPPDPGPFDYLTRSMESAIPKTYSLPDDIRGYFKDGKHQRLL